MAHAQATTIVILRPCRNSFAPDTQFVLLSRCVILSLFRAGQSHKPPKVVYRERAEIAHRRRQLVATRLAPTGRTQLLAHALPAQNRELSPGASEIDAELK